VKLAIIAALSRNRVIGKDGKLPWYLPEDLRRFKQLTTGHTVLMGRKTFESLGKPLANRRNIVVSSKPVPGLECYPSIDAALKALESEDLVFILGGGQVYSQLLERADYLYLTIIEREIEGDTFFPSYEHLIGTMFQLVKRESHDRFSFVDYVRV
jgi:dihydrofolate reductase